LKRIDEGAISVPDGVDIINAGENEENADLMADLGRGFVIAILLMFLILVVQFNAFVQPLLILFTILFAQIGVSVGLWLTDTPRSLAYILGVIALAGIVVNDAIIMIDQMNKNKRQEDRKQKTEDNIVSPSLHKEGVPVRLCEQSEQLSNKYSRGAKGRFLEDTVGLDKAILEAGTSRFIPVVLTTLTTSAGIIPLIFQDQFWAGLSYTVIFGLIVASALTLVITPITYYQFETEKGSTFLFLFSVILGTNGLFQFLGGNLVPGGGMMVVAALLFLWFLRMIKNSKTGVFT